MAATGMAATGMAAAATVPLGDTVSTSMGCTDSCAIDSAPNGATGDGTGWTGVEAATGTEATWVAVSVTSDILATGAAMPTYSRNSSMLLIRSCGFSSVAKSTARRKRGEICAKSSRPRKGAKGFNQRSLAKGSDSLHIS